MVQYRFVKLAGQILFCPGVSARHFKKLFQAQGVDPLLVKIELVNLLRKLIFIVQQFMNI